MTRKRNVPPVRKNLRNAQVQRIPRRQFWVGGLTRRFVFRKNKGDIGAVEKVCGTGFLPMCIGIDPSDGPEMTDWKVGPTAIVSFSTAPHSTFSSPIAGVLSFLEVGSRFFFRE